MCIAMSAYNSMACAGMSAERTAALQRAQKNSPPHFVTKRVADPNMIPMLVAAGVEFGAVKVCSHVSPPCRSVLAMQSVPA